MADEPDPEAKAPRTSRGERVGYIIAAVAVSLVIGGPLLIPMWRHFHPTQIEQAEQHLEFLKNNGASGDDVCAAYRAVQAAYEQAEDSKGYQDAKLYADIYCGNLELGRRLEGL
jgi:hypothetical protein